MSRACIFLADGFEEIEALTPADLLRRAGIRVDLVAVGDSLDITGRSGITVRADMAFEDAEFEGADMLVLPGGMPGTTNLENSKELKELIGKFDSEGKRIAAICAAPSVFGHMGLLEGRKAVCYKGMEGELYGAVIADAEAVTDGNITTSRGAGTAVEFALELIRVLLNEEMSTKVKEDIIYKDK